MKDNVHIFDSCFYRSTYVLQPQAGLKVQKPKETSSFKICSVKSSLNLWESILLKKFRRLFYAEQNYQKQLKTLILINFVAVYSQPCEVEAKSQFSLTTTAMITEHSVSTIRRSLYQQLVHAGLNENDFKLHYSRSCKRKSCPAFFMSRTAALTKT